MLIDMNYKEIDTQRIIDYIGAFTNGVSVDDIILHSGADKLRVYPALFELEQSGWLEVLEKRCMDGICTFCENILPREYGRSDPTEKYDDQKSGIVETAFSDHLQRSDRHLCTGTRIWHRNDARRKCGESKCDRGGDERTCVFLYVFRSDHCFDLIRSSSDRFERLGE